MVNWKVVYIKQAQKDAKKINSFKLKLKVNKLLKILKKNPYQINPSFEKLVGDLIGAYSRRINYQYRLVYQIYDDLKIVKVIRMWTHYK